MKRPIPILPVMTALTLICCHSLRADAPRTYVRQYPIADLIRVEPGRTRADQVDSLVSILPRFALPDTWKSVGGQTGEIHASGDVLVVTQSAEGHAAVRKVLGAIRQALSSGGGRPDLGPLSAYAILHRRVGDLRLEATPIAAAVERLRSDGQCEVEADWDAIGGAGIDQATPVTIHLYDATVGQALDAMCLGSRGIEYQVADGLVRLSTPGSIQPTLKAYDIRPLIRALLPPKSGKSNEWAQAGETRSDVIDSIFRAVEDLADTDSWQDNGGRFPLNQFDGTLLVMQTYRGHRKLSALLDALTGALLATSQAATAPASRPKPDKLDEVIDELQLDGQTIDQAIDMLADKAHANIVLDREAMSGADVLDKSLDLRLRNVPLHTALSVVLEVASPNGKLGYAVGGDDVILVSDADHLPNASTIRIYSIRDLIDHLLNGGHLHAPGSRARLAEDHMTRQDVVDSITKLIEDTVDTDAWKDNGGSIGSLRELGGMLIVTGNQDMHKKIDALLTKLRNEGLGAAAGAQP